MSDLTVNASQWALNAFALSNTQPVNGITGLTDAQSGAQALSASSSGGGSAGSSGGSSSTHISGRAQLYTDLQQLQQQNPAEFKQVVTQIANQLSTDAQSATGKQQQALENLANKFQSAEGGDLSSLQPPTPPSTANPAAALYSQYAQSTSGAQTGSSSAAGGAGGNSAVQQAMAYIANTLTSALNGGSSSGASAASSMPSAQNSGASTMQQAWSYILNTLNSALGGGSTTAAS